MYYGKIAIKMLKVKKYMIIFYVIVKKELENLFCTLFICFIFQNFLEVVKLNPDCLSKMPQPWCC